MSNPAYGRVVRVMGPVVDVRFEQDKHLPQRLVRVVHSNAVIDVHTTAGDNPALGNRHGKVSAFV